MTQFTEADIKAVGGLSRGDRSILHLDEIMPLALRAVPAFAEAVKGGGSIGKWWEAAKLTCRGLREANSETTLGFLLRKGLQASANNWYQLSERRWQEYAQQEGSNAIAEFYAPIYHTSIPGEVPRGGRFPEAAITGEDSRLRNRKFGQIVAIDRELFDDDQTGQIRQYAQRLGDGMGVTESVYCSSRFLGNARTYAGLTVTASEYTTTDINGTTVTGPFNAQLYGAAAGNRPSAFAALSLGPLAAAYVATMNAVDPMQNKIIVKPNTLLVSSMDALHADILLKPGGYPAVLGPSVVTSSVPVLGGTTTFTGSAANQGVSAGYPGGWNSPNPFQGMGWKIVIERYLPDWAWALGESGKGFIMQVRDPMEIAEEGKNSGSYFDFDTIRYRSRERFEADWVGGGSRFWYLGDDGSATGYH